MDAWMHVAGAHVLGHGAKVVTPEAGSHRVECACGYTSLVIHDDTGACLLLTLHLQAAVRAGARVVGGDDGLAGVREPRRPLPPDDELTVERGIA